MRLAEVGSVLMSAALSGVFCCAISATVTGAAPLSIALVSHDYPPFSISGTPDGAVSGVSTDLIGTALDRLHIAHPTTILPWVRALHTARETPMTCAYSVARVPERETWFRWVAPLADNDWTLFARADYPGTIKRLEDVGHASIGYYAGEAVGQDRKSVV